MSTTLQVPTKEQLETRYQAVIKLIKNGGSEAQARIAAHIRAITDGKHASLGVYHVAASIPMEVKFEEYLRIASSLGLNRDAGGVPSYGKPDFSKLQGQLGAGAKKADEDEESTTPALSEPRGVSPHPLTGAGRQTSVTVDSPASKSDLAHILAAEIQKHLTLPAQVASLDVGQIQLIVEEQLAKLDIPAQVKAANLNGAFPTERVEKMIAESASKQIETFQNMMRDTLQKVITALEQINVPHPSNTD